MGDYVGASTAHNYSNSLYAFLSSVSLGWVMTLIQST